MERNSDAHHVMYLKSHSVREEDKPIPDDSTLFLLNVPPYGTKVSVAVYNNIYFYFLSVFLI